MRFVGSVSAMDLLSPSAAHRGRAPSSSRSLQDGCLFKHARGICDAGQGPSARAPMKMKNKMPYRPTRKKMSKETLHQCHSLCRADRHRISWSPSALFFLLGFWPKGRRTVAQECTQKKKGRIMEKNKEMNGIRQMTKICHLMIGRKFTRRNGRRTQRRAPKHHRLRACAKGEGVRRGCRPKRAPSGFVFSLFSTRRLFWSPPLPFLLHTSRIGQRRVHRVHAKPRSMEGAIDQSRPFDILAAIGGGNSSKSARASTFPLFALRSTPAHRLSIQWTTANKQDLAGIADVSIDQGRLFEALADSKSVGRFFYPPPP